MSPTLLRFLGYLLVGSLWIFIILMVLFGLGAGDCSPEVQNCHETGRKIGHVVVVVGFAGLAYLVVRFFKRMHAGPDA